MAFSITKRLIWFLVLLTIVFAIHLGGLYFLELSLWNNQIVLSYTLNYLIAAIIMVGLFVVRRKHKDNLGYLYMVGSLLKFALFFLVFYPIYKSDGNMSKEEFFTFFIPYFTCLILETLTLIKLLNFLDNYASKKPENKQLK